MTESIMAETLRKRSTGVTVTMIGGSITHGLKPLSPVSLWKDIRWSSRHFEAVPITNEGSLIEIVNDRDARQWCSVRLRPRASLSGLHDSGPLACHGRSSVTVEI